MDSAINMEQNSLKSIRPISTNSIEVNLTNFSDQNSFVHQCLTRSDIYSDNGMMTKSVQVLAESTNKDKEEKRTRTIFTAEQVKILEKQFEINQYISKETRENLSEKLNLPINTIKIWFQNRRMKEKRIGKCSWNFWNNPYGQLPVFTGHPVMPPYYSVSPSVIYNYPQLTSSRYELGYIPLEKYINPEESNARNFVETFTENSASVMQVENMEDKSLQLFRPYL